MSLEIAAKLICDNCRCEIIGKTCNRSTRSGESYWDASRTAAKNGWLTVSRGRYRVPAHYCKDCADKPMVKIKDPPRIPKCKRCRGGGWLMEWIGGVGKSSEKCPDCDGTGKRKAHSQC